MTVTITLLKLIILVLLIPEVIIDYLQGTFVFTKKVEKRLKWIMGICLICQMAIALVMIMLALCFGADTKAWYPLF